MSDWDIDANRPRFGNKSSDAAGLRLTRSLIDWFGSLDSFTVIFGSCVATSLIVLVLLQASKKEPAPKPLGTLFQALPRPEEGVAPIPDASPGDRMMSSLEFIPSGAASEQEETPAEAPRDPQPPPFSPNAMPQLPALPQVPARPKGADKAIQAALSAVKAQAAAGSGASGGFAAGAKVGSQRDETQARNQGRGALAGAIGSQRDNASQEEMNVVRKLIPIVQEFQRSGASSSYGTSGQRQYRAEQFGRSVMEKDLLLSTGAIVTERGARALAEGLGLHVPKNTSR